MENFTIEQHFLGETCPREVEEARENFRKAVAEQLPGVQVIESSGSPMSRFTPEQLSAAQFCVMDEEDLTVDEHGLKPLERMASDDNLQGVKKLIKAGANTLIHHHGLFPYHFASSTEAFRLLTHPPIEWRAFMLTLAR